MGQDVDRAMVRAGLRPRNRAQADNDFWALVVQRGWLFLRLYMFTFVLSEPGTWRRYCLLIIGVIVCLLPRQNPLNNFFAGARRHVDNLIGPPQPQPRDRDRAWRQQEAARQTAAAQAAVDARQATAAGSSTRLTPAARGTVAVTPEQNARRLIREHEQRNPNILRDLFYRLEQAVALFLASLIPGVGERHVAAREEARRRAEEERLEAQRAREEEEKKRVEEAEKGKQGQTANDEAGEGSSNVREAAKDGAPSVASSLLAEPSSTTGEGSSTSVQAEAAAGDDGGVRARFS